MRVQIQLRLRNLAVTSRLYELKIRRAPLLTLLSLPQIQLEARCPEDSCRLKCSEAVVRIVSSVGSVDSGALMRPMENWLLKFLCGAIVMRVAKESGLPLPIFQRPSSGSRPRNVDASNCKGPWTTPKSMTS